MPEAVYRMMTLLCALVVTLPVGTNLGLLHVLWMLVSGQLLGARGAVIPGLSACGLSDRAVRRAWATLGQGDWASDRLLARWGALVAAEGHWQPHTHGGYRPVAVDVTAFWRPQLHACPTVHYHAAAGRALPAIPRSEEHTSELQSQSNIVCRLLLEKKKTHNGSLVNTSEFSSRRDPKESILQTTSDTELIDILLGRSKEVT